jgi:hypothetical protein
MNVDTARGVQVPKIPDLLGVCEIENRFVLDLHADPVHGLLPGRQYGIVHADTDNAI